MDALLPYFLEDDDLVHFILEKYKKKPRYYHALEKTKTAFNLDKLTNDYCWLHFRFYKPDLVKMKEQLEISDLVKCNNRFILSGMEGLCILLKRLIYPGRLADLMKFFPRTTCELSRIVNRMTRLILQKHLHRLTVLNQTWLTAARLQEFCDALVAKGSPYNRCVGFLDGTLRPISRPLRNQREYYNGHKRVHGIKFQSLLFPNGLIGNLYGPTHGRRHDGFLLESSGLLQQMENTFVTANGTKYHLYSDPAYPLHPHLITPFHIHNLNRERRFCNKVMSRLRVSVERGFGKVLQYFGFLDFKKNLKIGRQPVHSYYQVAAILSNCHSCLYSSQTSDYFSCSPPSLEEYLS